MDVGRYGARCAWVGVGALFANSRCVSSALETKTLKCCQHPSHNLIDQPGWPSAVRWSLRRSPSGRWVSSCTQRLLVLTQVLKLRGPREPSKMPEPPALTRQRWNLFVPSSPTQAGLNDQRMIFLRRTVANLSVELPSDQSDPTNCIAVRAPRCPHDRNAT